MRVSLVTVSSRPPAWAQTAFDDYAQRLKPRLPLTVRELALGNRKGGADPQRAVADEGKRILAALSAQDHVVALDERGTERSTREFAAWLGRRLQEAQDLVFLIGGPDGFDALTLARANERWSLSKLTLPHALAKVLFVEQLYRAVTVLDGHPYHRD
ncbi:MAG: 23S rRNA (pseudouridine(1915)-N(3))-methyltransferase RlmH [Steroidobacteraceae bacterium]